MNCKQKIAIKGDMSNVIETCGGEMNNKGELVTNIQVFHEKRRVIQQMATLYQCESCKSVILK